MYLHLGVRRGRKHLEKFQLVRLALLKLALYLALKLASPRTLVLIVNYHSYSRVIIKSPNYPVCRSFDALECTANDHLLELAFVMAEIAINASQWRMVEVGRVVLFTHGKYTGRLAVIVEIIDNKRVCIKTKLSN